MKSKKKNVHKIFVQLASYRDPQLVPTIRDLLNKADNPNMFSIGICWQKDNTEDLEEFTNHPQVRYITYNYTQSKGLGWARAEVAKLYKGEELTLQLDSHHRFAKGWDTMMLEDYNQALKLSNKPLLSTYLTPFNVSKYEEEGIDSLIKLPSLMSQYEFSSDKLLMSMPWYIQDYEKRNQIIRARTLSGHFYLVNSKFINEVPYDPDIYFGGYCEETTMSLRAYTHGYDFFSPYRGYIWHEYTREGRPKHWDDHGKKSETEKTSGERDVLGRKKTRQLFQQEDNNLIIENKYNIGNVRTIKDYEEYAGFDFKKQRLQDYTLKVKEPPNPLPWEDQFITNQFKLSFDWDIQFFKNHNFTKPKFLTLGIQNNSGTELYRKDFTIENDPDYVNLIKNSYSVTINSIDTPKKIVMYLFDENKSWSNVYEKNI